MNQWIVFSCSIFFEHLANPIECLDSFYRLLRPGGRLILEVPHGNDFLIRKFPTENYLNFIFWSQHLILHSRSSLNRLFYMLKFNTVHVESFQRYGLLNHLTWLGLVKPGGHKDILFEGSSLNSQYSTFLSKNDNTDTFYA